MPAGSSIIRLSIQGMHCIMCARSIELALKNTKGIKSVRVNYNLREAIIEKEPDLNENEIIEKVNRLGYKASLDYIPENTENRTDIIRFALGFIFSITVMLIVHTGGTGIYFTTYGYLLGLASLPVMVFISFPIFVSALNNIKNFNLSMDVMYALGIITASLSTTGGYLGFLSEEFIMPDTPVMLGSFLLLGRFLERVSRSKANLSIEKLLLLKPRKANKILQKDGKEEITEIDSSELKDGDILLVRASEQIPSDGVILGGSAHIDTSLITGERIPVFAQEGDRVIGGTINTDGVIRIKATASGEETVISKIIKIALEASARRTNIERFADAVIRYFLPVVILLSTGASLFWYFYLDKNLASALSVFISTIVISCPCALGLATPAAVSSGILKSSKLGLLIKDPAVFEKIGKIRTIAMDKTGTLTRGDLSVKTIYHNESIGPEEFIRIAHSFARLSKHPLSEGITKTFSAQKKEFYDISGLRVIHGKGLKGIIGKEMYFFGSPDFLRENGIESPDFPEDNLTSVCIARENKFLGYIILEDTPDSNAYELSEWLRKNGYNLVILSGDRKESVKGVAQKTGADMYYYQMTPRSKAEKIFEMKNAGDSVLFAGDGTNDAPALLAADIGVAIGRGTDIAVESGDVIIIKDDIRLICVFIEIAKKVMLRIKLNLFWATIYNITLIPFAMGLSRLLFGVVFRPELSALAMIFSSLSVTLISLSINFYRPSVLKEKTTT